MIDVSFADVSQQAISFSKSNPSEKLVLDLIDTAWAQRLRDISQTANVRLLYMFSEHSRFGHSLGVAFLACQLMEKLGRHYYADIEPYRAAVAAAALLHDIGHLAPGSHMAQRTWFPNSKDSHEQTAVKIIKSDPEILSKLFSPSLLETICMIISEDKSLPAWTWQIISGGGWNVDRGNWCIIDSVMAGVSYGKYNIPALIDAIVLTKDKQLALRENRLDAMLHFSISRQAMYRQIYLHRVILASETIIEALIKRARDLFLSSDKELFFTDDTMRNALKASSVNELSLADIFNMTESWFRYHLMRWRSSSDPILSDLAERHLQRKLFKTVRILPQDNSDELYQEARNAVIASGYNPEYYLHKTQTVNINRGDANQSILVQLDDGTIQSFSESEPIFGSMLDESKNDHRAWFVMPAEAKEILGRKR